mgnify:CR=1 FL=1
MAALEKAGIAENTLIVLSSDNGPVVDDGYADQAVELLGDHRPGATSGGASTAVSKPVHACRLSYHAGTGEAGCIFRLDIPDRPVCFYG